MKRIVIAFLLITMTLYVNAQAKKVTPPRFEYSYKCIRGNDMASVSKLLQTYFDLGWEPVMSEAQNVSTSINKYSESSGNTLKGEVIFILRKKN